MEKSNKIWSKIEAATQEHKDLRLSDSVDYKKFYLYSIITHSSAIEGSTLTEKETQILFDEGLTAKGKPLLHHLMNEDLKNAYVFATDEADKKTTITPDFLKQLNAIVMKSTGGIFDGMGGRFDSAKGEFRKIGVTAGFGGASYMNFQKVPAKVDELCSELSKRLEGIKGLKEIHNLSFDAHLNLVTIHPWADGNGRTSRLLMNYIQFLNGVFPSKIHKEDKSAYIDSLIESQEKETPQPFRDFMASQHLKTLKEEIQGFKQSNKKGLSLLF